MSLLLAVLSGLCFERTNAHLVVQNMPTMPVANESALDLIEQKGKRLNEKLARIVSRDLTAIGVKKNYLRMCT